MARSKQPKATTAELSKQTSEPTSSETMTSASSTKASKFPVLSPTELKDYGLDLEDELVISVKLK